MTQRHKKTHKCKYMDGHKTETAFIPLSQAYINIKHVKLVQ